jgi:TetR/AcrR family transcriptional regulator
MTKKATTAKKGARVPARDGETEQKILDAARAVFIRRGTAGARMQEIAREAGVNQALLHYYFRSKERLAGAVFQQLARGIFPSLAQILGSDLPLEAKAEQLVGVYLENLSRSPFLPGYLLSEMHHHPERLAEMLGGVIGGRPSDVMAPVFAKVDGQIHARVAAGTMRPITTVEFVVNLISLCIFPFAARPMLGALLGMDDDTFAQFIEQRKKNLPEFYRHALRP